MANFRPSTAARNAALTAMGALLDAGAAAGKLRIYDGTQPAGPNTAITTQVLLAELTLSDPALAAPSAGTAALSAITGDASANNTGTATWARFVDSDGNAVWDCDISDLAGDGTLKLNSTSVVAAAPVSVTSFSVTQPAG